MRKTVVVPAAGEEIQIPMTGRSVIVESGSLYDLPSDVPLIGFDPGGDQYPLYPRSTYQAKQCYNNIIITGTAASEGDEFILISFVECLGSEINVNYSESYEAYTKASFSIALDNNVDQFTELQLIDADGNLPNKVFISTRDEDFVFAFDVDPEQDAGADLGTPWSEAQGLLEIEGINFILALRFRARVAAETPTITVHLEY